MNEKQKIRFILFEVLKVHKRNYEKEFEEYKNDLRTNDYRDTYKAFRDVIEACISHRHETIDELQSFLKELKTDEISVPDEIKNGEKYMRSFTDYCDQLGPEVKSRIN